MLADTHIQYSDEVACSFSHVGFTGLFIGLDTREEPDCQCISRWEINRVECSNESENSCY